MRVTVESFIRAQLLLQGVDVKSAKTLVSQIVEEVGLGNARSRRISALSLGMRQRAALACCLVAQPKLLILDEPLNGLDADGVLWLTDLLRKHRDAGGSILLSSHLMAEMQAVADSIVILGNKTVAAQGPLCELASTPKTLIGVKNGVNELKSLLDRKGFSSEIDRAGRISVIEADPATVGNLAFSHGFSVNHLCLEEHSLEEIYGKISSKSR